MGQLSYLWSIVDRSIITWHMTTIMTAVNPEGISEGAGISLKGKNIPLRVTCDIIRGKTEA